MQMPEVVLVSQTPLNVFLMLFNLPKAPFTFYLLGGRGVGVGMF